MLGPMQPGLLTESAKTCLRYIGMFTHFDSSAKLRPAGSRFGQIAGISDKLACRKYSVLAGFGTHTLDPLPSISKLFRGASHALSSPFGMK